MGMRRWSGEEVGMEEGDMRKVTSGGSARGERDVSYVCGEFGGGGKARERGKQSEKERERDAPMGYLFEKTNFRR